MATNIVLIDKLEIIENSVNIPHIYETENQSWKPATITVRIYIYK